MRRKAYEKCVGNGHKKQYSKHSLYFWGFFLIVSATLMSEHEMLQKKIINAGGSAEGPGWFVAYTYCMNSVNMLLFVPIAVAFAGGENTEAELHSRFFFLFSYIRSGEKTVSRRKSSRIVGLRRFDSFFLAMVFLLVICILRFGQYPSLIDGNYEMAVLVGRTAVSFLRLFLNGAFWALIGGTPSAVITKKSLYVLCRSFYSLLCPDRISGALLSKSILSESPLLGGVYLLQ